MTGNMQLAITLFLDIGYWLLAIDDLFLIIENLIFVICHYIVPVYWILELKIK